MPDIATPAGIRQAYQIHGVSEQVRDWDREALKGLTYITTGRGPTGSWLKTIGKTEEGRCGVCEERTLQNGAHLLSCSGVGDGKGRTLEEAAEDMEWCRAVVRAL